MVEIGLTESSSFCSFFESWSLMRAFLLSFLLEVSKGNNIIHIYIYSLAIVFLSYDAEYMLGQDCN